MSLSEHFTYEEMTHTSQPYDNTPGEVEFANMVITVAELEKAREIVGPLKVNSGYRSARVNKSVGGATNSAHMRGLAADVVPMRVSLKVAFDLICDSDIPYDKLILEPTWIHFQVAPLGVEPRRKKYLAHPTDQGMVYEEVP